MPVPKWATWSPKPSEPMGCLLIDSTPHAITMSISPAEIAWAAKAIAACPEPSCRFTVTPAMEVGRPLASKAFLPMFKACSPIWVTHPQTRSSTIAGSILKRSFTRWLMRKPRLSSDRRPLSAPLRTPVGVRTASTMNTSRTGNHLPHDPGCLSGIRFNILICMPLVLPYR